MSPAADIGNGCDERAAPEGFEVMLDPRPLAEQMAAFDALPLRVRLACKYAPLDIMTLPLEEAVATHGPTVAVPEIVAFLASAWPLLGAEPLRP